MRRRLFGLQCFFTLIIHQLKEFFVSEESMSEYRGEQVWSGSGGHGPLVPGPRCTNGFSIAIQIRWKLRFTLISILIRVIATKFCTWHDSCAVVTCANTYCDLVASNGITARRSFHRIWIASKKIVSEASRHNRKNGQTNKLHIPHQIIMLSN